MKEYYIICRGNIQGVGYRSAVCSIADRLRIIGYVKNLPDKTVEIYCKGKDESMKEFLEDIRIMRDWGPFVEKMLVFSPGDVNFKRPLTQMNEFNIRF